MAQDTMIMSWLKTQWHGMVMTWVNNDMERVDCVIQRTRIVYCAHVRMGLFASQKISLEFSKSRLR